MARRDNHRTAALALLVLLGFQLGGCAGPGYYAQAISGHLRIMHARVEISTVLENDNTDPALAARLRQSQEVLSFARDQLGLPANGKFSQFVVTGKDAITWNVVTAPEFSLEPRLWCFPVAGCVPYRGYFEQTEAEEFAARMKSRSLDVAVSPATAYSTLGWFEDPLLDTMLQYSDPQLAGIMFHELAHDRLYVKSDSAFSEAFASFVEQIGVRLWLTANNQGTQLEKWNRTNAAAQQFNHLLLKTRQELQELYTSAQADETKRENKSRLFEALQREYRHMVQTGWSGVDYFATWMSGEQNNASLAILDSYEGGVCEFNVLYDSAGRDLEQFYRLAEEKAALDPAQRKAWLEQPCPGPVSTGEL
ncbi:MAG: aminopeptidase [Xanthomonadales bacterium]|nr:aminopeptidase [Xanthomonadales bacterium]